MIVQFAVMALAPSFSELYEARAFHVNQAKIVLVDDQATFVQLQLFQERGNWVARVVAEEGGASILGRDERFAPARYRQTLDGGYSMPFRNPDGRLRVFRDRVGKMLRFAWGFEDSVAGERVQGWMELAPLPDPFPGDVTVEAAPGTLTTVKVPTKDKDDRKTGFKVTKRQLNWSGAFGEAFVVTFDDAFPWRSKDIKLAFWSEGAWTPFWVMSPRAMQGYEFLETWGGGGKGCYEPMSDRVNRWAKAEVVEDNEARKIIRWRYALVNPDYVPWGAPFGSKQLPEAEEEWTILPDGTVYRLQRFWPSLDTSEPQHSLGVQLAEADVVFSSDSLPEEVLPPLALTGFGPKGLKAEAIYPRKTDRGGPKIGDEARFGYATHFLDPTLPDPFIGFADPGLDSSLDWKGTWHEERFWRFSHFPFNSEPFASETNSQTDGRGVITHTCLAYVGDARGRDWSDRFQVDARGRKFREWASVIGMEPKGSLKKMDERLSDWQEGARWEKLVTGAKAKWNPARGELVLSEVTGTISIAPSWGRIPTLSLPGEREVKNVRVKGGTLAKGKDWRSGEAGGRRIVWISPAIQEGPLTL